MLLFCNHGFSQTLAFKNYNSAQGLPSSETYCFLQDYKGYVWIATDRGLVKYDGYTFKPWSSAEGMPDNTIFKMESDAKHRIWFQSYSSKLGYIENDKIYSYPYNSIIKKIIPFQMISNWIIDENNSVWLSWPDKHQSLLYRITATGKLDSSLNEKDPNARKAYVTNTGVCLLSGMQSAKNIQFYSLQTGKYLHSITLKDEITDQYVVYKTDKGKTWIYINNQVFLVENGISRRIIKCDDKALSVMMDSNNNIWVGHMYRGVEFYDCKSGYKKKLGFLKKYSISSINMDNEGGMWITTLENGVYYIRQSKSISYTENDGLSSPKVMRIENINGAVLLFLSDFNMAIKYPGNPGLAFLKNPGTMVMDVKYKPQAPGSLYYLRPAKMNFPFKEKTINLTTEFSAEKIVIGKKCIWGLAYHLIFQYNMEGKKLRDISFEKLARVKCAFEMKNGHLLVGTLDGLYEFDGTNIMPLNKLNPVWGYRISDIKRVDSRHLAIATIGYGVYIVNENDFGMTPISYSEKDGLPSIMCKVVLSENDSVIWVGTNKGLCRISYFLNPKKAGFYTMDIGNGLISNEINDIQIIDGQLWVATMDGLSIVPTIPDTSTAKSSVFLENIKVNEKVVSAQESSVFSYQKNMLSFSFTGINYQYAGRLEYTYKLEPVDQDWSLTSNRSVIAYSLAPGKYRFLVMATIPSGKLKSSTAMYSFEILPPFWRTWWFIGLVILAIVVSLNTFIRYRIRFVKKREQLKNELNSSKEKALRAQMKPHFIYNTLNTIELYILNKEVPHSLAFLSKFSMLMRLTFTNTNKASVCLKDELDALRLYAELENLRFNNKFQFHVHTASSIDMLATNIPPLIMQPLVENSIKHGLSTKKGNGNIWVDIDREGDRIKVKIKDDGIGRGDAEIINQKKQKYSDPEIFGHEDRKDTGLTITLARIEQVWRQKGDKKTYDRKMFEITDLFTDNNNPEGTLIEFYLPISYD